MKRITGIIAVAALLPTVAAVPARAAQAAPPGPSLRLGVSIAPSSYVPRRPLSYKITLFNAAATPVRAEITASVARIWEDVPFSCFAWNGSCPRIRTGAPSGWVFLAPRGSVILLGTALVPRGTRGPLQVSAAVRAPGECADGCGLSAVATRR
jgi:hypothetical protein